MQTFIAEQNILYFKAQQALEQDEGRRELL